MTATDWTGKTGNWTTPADWSAGVPTSAVDALVEAGGTYTVTLSSAAHAKSLLLAAAGSTFSETASGSLAAKGGFTIETGAAILDAANVFGGATVDGGAVVIGASGALGSGIVDLSGGLLTNNATLSLGNFLDISGAPTIAAAHGTTFQLGGKKGWQIDLTNPTTLTFGTPGDDGTVFWDSASASFTAAAISQPFHVVVAAGTLRAGTDSLSVLLSGARAGDVTIAAGATVNLSGFNTGISALQGAGTLTSSSAATAALYGGAVFAGRISGRISVTVGSQILTGANTYTGATVIGDGGDLFLGNDTTTGSIAASSVVDDSGDLLIARTNAITIANFISGPGQVEQLGTGTTILSHANTYSGGTLVDHGTLWVTNASGLGSGVLVLSPGTRFVAGATLGLPSGLDIGGSTSLAAATGDTLSTSASTPWSFQAQGATLTFGVGGRNGVVVWNTPAGYSIGDAASFAINVAYGTLRAGDDSFDVLTDHALNGAVSGTTIGASGTLDANGHALSITKLGGSGVIEDTGAATTLTITGGAFSGSINGPLSPILYGVATLTGGLGDFAAALKIESNAALTLAGGSAHGWVFANNKSAPTTVILSSGASETGTFQGFGANDTLDFRGVLFATAKKSFAFNATKSSGGKLTVTDGTHTETVALAGDYTGATFSLASDGHGGANITVSGAKPAAGQADLQRFTSAMAGFAGANPPASAAVGAGARPAEPLAVAAPTWRAWQHP